MKIAGVDLKEYWQHRKEYGAANKAAMWSRDKNATAMPFNDFMKKKGYSQGENGEDIEPENEDEEDSDDTGSDGGDGGGGGGGGGIQPPALNYWNNKW